MKPDKTPLYLPHLKQQRKALRNEPTPAEYKLWFSLRQQKLDGRSFRRQTSIENYIVDFYCHSEKLVIELDGHGHFELEGQLRDEQRDMRLRELGYTVLRFENKMIF
ncbi:MAG TPA: endonuclease domain-containing protein, partial [Chitinophagales bacterium]|nr:endonuclease domain-containing protein [Chitinophagales bacterium]